MATSPSHDPSTSWLERQFKLSEHHTTLRTEVMAGLTTFMTMAYIMVVNPGIVSATGMPFEAVMYATVASASVSTLLMAFLANYPIALAPGMGLNAYFTYTVVLGMGVPWQTALGAVFLSGLAFIVLTLTGVREALITTIPSSLKAAIGAGIGLFIAFIGLKNGGVIVSHPATFVSLADLRTPPAFLTLGGTILTLALMARGVRGAILWGILATALVGVPLGVTPIPEAVVELPRLSRWQPILGQLDIGAALRLGLVEIIFAFFFVDVFDNVGTLVAVGRHGGFVDKSGRLPRANRALMADALGTVAGSVFGTPTVTSYIESAAGVAVGGRTGLVGVVVSTLFLFSLFFAPVVKAVASVGCLTAPALVVVGVLMIRSVTDIDWEDLAEAGPAFIALIAMPLTFSIATGIALAFIAYPAIKVLAGRGREVPPLMYALGILFVLRFVYLGGE